MSSLPALLEQKKKRTVSVFEMAQERLFRFLKFEDYFFMFCSFEFSFFVLFFKERIVFTKFELLLGFCCKGQRVTG